MDRRQFLKGTAVLSGTLASLRAATAAKPKVRAITAFVSMDAAHHERQIHETLNMLRRGQQVIEAAGYDVETLRITTQPFPEIARGMSRQDAVRFFGAYADLAAREKFGASIGPAIMHDGDDAGNADLLAEILAAGKGPNASIVIASTDGIHWRAIQAAARVMKSVAGSSPASAGNFSFAATAMLAPYGPFFPGSYHAGPGRRFSIGTEGANVVEQVFAATAGNAPVATERLSQALSTHAVALERSARQIEKETGWTYMGIDATPAPLGDVSIGAAIERFTGEKFGSSGTMTAAAVITRAVQSLPIKRVGYAGLMVPVMEDRLLAQRWAEGAYGIDALLAYSAVCGTGLDTIPLPGNTSQLQIERILGDVATLAFKWNKPLSARLLPVAGKEAGERTAFDDPRMVNTLIRPVP
jgi:uncharacterized protein (UPF0210 family)